MSQLRLTVLGASPSTPNPNGAGSGYLAIGPRECVLLDCGPGVVGRLRAHGDLDTLDAVAVSHFHQDHFIDLLSLRYWVKYGPGRRTRPLTVFLPPGGRAHLARLGRAIDDNPGFFDQVLALEEYAPGSAFEVGMLAVRPVPVQHYVPSYALIVTVDGRRMTYSADAAPCHELVQAARGAHLFLCEASLDSAAEDPGYLTGERGHMAAHEAGEAARAATVERLVLTHFAMERGAQRLAAAQERFGGPVTLAREGERFEV